MIQLVDREGLLSPSGRADTRFGPVHSFGLLVRISHFLRGDVIIHVDALREEFGTMVERFERPQALGKSDEGRGSAYSWRSGSTWNHLQVGKR